jgi:hypothetical protein
VSVRPAAAQCGGAACVQYLAGGAGDVERERAGRREGVWELAGSGVRSFVGSAGDFIGQEAEGDGVQ